MRKIQPDMLQWIDKRLKTNGLAQHAIDQKDARTLFRLAAESCVGIKEQGGDNKGPLVELIQKTIGDAEREPWCMALIQTCLAYAEAKTGKVSPVIDSEHCLTVWTQTPARYRVAKIPAPGAIAIWQHGRSQAGHTGVVLEVIGNTLSMVEGNTTQGLDSKGEIVREGGGCYLTKRSIYGQGTMRLLGYLKPFV